MLIPYPHAVQRTGAVPRWGLVWTPHLHLRTDKAGAFARTVFALECLPTLAVALTIDRARNVRDDPHHERRRCRTHDLQRWGEEAIARVQRRLKG